AQDHAIEDSRARPWQGHAEERLPSAGPEREGGFLLLVALRLEYRENLACHEGKRDEDRGEDDAGDGEDDLPVVRREEGSKEPLPTEQQDEHETCDDGRD